MSYEKQVWTNGDIITADSLNHIENGIEANIDSLDDIIRINPDRDAFYITISDYVYKLKPLNLELSVGDKYKILQCFVEKKSNGGIGKSSSYLNEYTVENGTAMMLHDVVELNCNAFFIVDTETGIEQVFNFLSSFEPNTLAFQRSIISKYPSFTFGTANESQIDSCTFLQKVDE